MWNRKSHLEHLWVLGSGLSLSLAVLQMKHCFWMHMLHFNTGGSTPMNIEYNSDGCD